MKSIETPKWGTKEWIAAYPWSKMDRRRRRRVLAVLPKDLAELLAQDAGYIPFLRAVTSKVKFDKSVAGKVAGCMGTAEVYAVKVVDFVVSAALGAVWAGKSE